MKDPQNWQAETESARREQPIRVVLADDHAVVRAGIRQFLERAGDIIILAEADDGEQARVFIEHYRPDVAVLDIQMPHATGIEVTRWIRQRHREIGILILTAYDDDPYVLAVLQAGANGYVLKTASPAEIIGAVRDVYQGKSVLDPAITQTVLGHLGGQHQLGPVEKLTKRELEVLKLAAKGFTNKAIGVQLGISDRTVQGHLAKIYGKLQAGSRTEAVMRAVFLGWLPPELGELE
ncbi:MAG: response regulator transcription factor [Chloroflexi bacterium]|nr:response regulator transcription factor [Chloroflexota bacterium]